MQLKQKFCQWLVANPEEVNLLIWTYSWPETIGKYKERDMAIGLFWTRYVRGGELDNLEYVRECEILRDEFDA